MYTYKKGCFKFCLPYMCKLKQIFMKKNKKKLFIYKNKITCLFKFLKEMKFRYNKMLMIAIKNNKKNIFQKKKLSYKFLFKQI